MLAQVSSWGKQRKQLKTTPPFPPARGMGCTGGCGRYDAKLQTEIKSVFLPLMVYVSLR